jgi:hypothetical protein
MSFESNITKIIVTSNGVKAIDGISLNSDLHGSANYKIYVLTMLDQFIYVGLTKQKIGTKLQQGFKSYLKDLEGKRQAGYGGYKWIKKHIETENSLTLHVFDLGCEIAKSHSEAIEAEIVYAIRQETGMWPLEQNEIHFNNENSLSQEFGRRIFNKLSLN